MAIRFRLLNVPRSILHKPSSRRKPTKPKCPGNIRFDIRYLIPSYSRLKAVTEKDKRIKIIKKFLPYVVSFFMVAPVTFLIAFSFTNNIYFLIGITILAGKIVDVLLKTIFGKNLNDRFEPFLDGTLGYLRGKILARHFDQRGVHLKNALRFFRKVENPEHLPPFFDFLRPAYRLRQEIKKRIKQRKKSLKQDNYLKPTELHFLQRLYEVENFVLRETRMKKGENIIDIEEMRSNLNTAMESMIPKPLA